MGQAARRLASMQQDTGSSAKSPMVSADTPPGGAELASQPTALPAAQVALVDSTELDAAASAAMHTPAAANRDAPMPLVSEGKPMKRFCPCCGGKAQLSHNFCHWCGAYLDF